MEPKTYTLKHPVTVGSETISVLSFRRPVAGDFKDVSLQNITAGDLMKAAGKMCGQPQQVIEKIDLEDVFALTELVTDFLPSGLLTGLKP